MKKLIGLGLFGLFIAFPSIAAGDSAQRPGKQEPAIICKKAQAVQISATIYGNFHYAFEGVGAWVGYALVSFGDAPAKLATIVDRITSFGQRKNGEVYGTEILSLRFADGSGTFDVDARFVGLPQSTPSLYYLQETGTIGNGAGKYALVSGSVTVRGPFLNPDPAVVADAPPLLESCTA